MGWFPSRVCGGTGVLSYVIHMSFPSHVTGNRSRSLHFLVMGHLTGHQKFALRTQTFLQGRELLSPDPGTDHLTWMGSVPGRVGPGALAHLHVLLRALPLSHLSFSSSEKPFLRTSGSRAGHVCSLLFSSLLLIKSPV